MSFRPLLLAALVLPLSACGGDDDGTDTTTVVETPAAPAPTTTPAPTTPDAVANEVTVQGTIDAAGTDITQMAPAAAVANIDGWIAKLQGAQFDQADDIVEDLTTLKAQLSATPLDGAAIGRTLVELGEETTESAAGAASSSQEGLRTLGGALTAAGQRLGGA